MDACAFIRTDPTKMVALPTPLAEAKEMEEYRAAGPADDDSLRKLGVSL
jgi:hypothetical protein